MSDQPEPGNDLRKISCLLCTYSRQSDPNPETLRRSRVCTRFPPQIVTMPTPNGPAIVGAAFPMVADETWCHSFNLQTANENSNANAPRVSELVGGFEPFFRPKLDA